MPRKSKRRPERATDGGSRVALAARLAPGGRHGRRKAQRDVAKRAAIREQTDNAGRSLDRRSFGL